MMRSDIWMIRGATATPENHERVNVRRAMTDGNVSAVV